MATLIQPNGTTTDVHPVVPATHFTLDQLYALLGCDMVEAVQLADGRVMWLDEEGKLHAQPQPINDTATRLLQEAGGITGDVVLGPVLICTPAETGDTAETGDAS